MFFAHDSIQQRGLFDFDMNPANLTPLPTDAEAVKFVVYISVSSAILKRAQKDFKRGEYRWVATAVSKLVKAPPDNDKARTLLADTYEQLAYQSENMGWRNAYFTGAQKLRVGHYQVQLKPLRPMCYRR